MSEVVNTGPEQQPEGFAGATGPEREPEGPTGVAAVVGPFVNAIVGPADCMRALDQRPILAAWIAVWIAIFTTVMSVYNLPITQRVMVQSALAGMRAQGQDVTPEAAQNMQQMMVWLGSIIAYGSSLIMLLLIAVTALVIWVLASIMGGKGATFGRSFGVAAAAGVVRPLLYSLYVTIILNMNPPEIRRPQDAATMTPTLGLDILLTGPDTPLWLNAIFQRIDLFNLWWMAVVVSGSVTVLKLSKKQGMALAGIVWVVGTLFAVAMALLQGLNAG